jgi:hypothetical protein
MKYLNAARIILGLSLLATGCSEGIPADDNEASHFTAETKACCAADGILTAAFNKFPINDNGPFDLPTANQVCVARKQLTKFDTDVQIQRQMKGGFLIDGVLLGAKDAPDHKEEITVRVDKVLFGDNGRIPKELRIISSQERYGGVTVAVGEPYMLFIVPMHGRYYSWASTGSAPTDQAFSGFYRCTEE